RGRLPALPIARGPGHGLEGEQVEFAVEDVEQLLGALVQVRADVEARGDLGFERRPRLRLFGSYFEGHSGARDRASRAGRKYQPIGHGARLAAMPVSILVVILLARADTGLDPTRTRG